MHLKKIMKAYYKNKLDQIEKIQPRFKLKKHAWSRPRFAHLQRWEDILGIGITACYLIQLLLPGNWFFIGRCFSVFKIGF